MPFRFVEKNSTTQIEFEATSKTAGGLFKDAAMAICNIMVNPRSVKQRKTKKISVYAADPEQLMAGFLRELISLKDTDSFVFSKVTVRLKGTTGLNATVHGESVNVKRQDIRNSIKSIMSRSFFRKKGEWYAHVAVEV